MTTSTLIIILAAVLLLAVIVGYNGLVRARNKVDNAWAQVDVQLKRRYDLVPNLVETVKGYAGHEQETFNRVVEARTRAVEARTVEEQEQAEGMLTGALRRLFALAENYPQLRASENFQQLQTQLEDAENKIAVSRQIYNDTTLTYNNKVQVVPTNLVAFLFRFRRRPFFEAGEEDRSLPRVGL